MNFLQMMLCMLASAVVSLFSEYGVIAMSAAMVLRGTLVIVGYGLIRKERKQPALAKIML